MIEEIVDLATNCASTNLRRTELVVTQFYDGMLAPSGLYAVQLGLLSAISKLVPMTIDRLAYVMDMDDITLNQQIKILIEQELVYIEEANDRGASQLFLTQEGQQVLEGAWSFWQEAQERVEAAFGPERFNALLGELLAIRTALNSGAI